MALKVDPLAPKRKKALAKAIKAMGLRVPRGYNWKTPVVGSACRSALKLYQSAKKLPVTGKFDAKTLAALFPLKRSFTIGSTWHAVTHGGVRSTKSIRQIILHSMEYQGDTAAEALGRLSCSRAYGASPHFGIDDDSLQQYLPITVVGWHAQGANTCTIGIEQAGYARWSREQWLNHSGTLDRTAWLLARLSKQTGIPLAYVDAAGLRKGTRGISTHADVTKAYSIAGGHVDPGKNYPMDWVLKRARAFRDA